MKLPESTKSIILKHNVKVDYTKEYAEADLVLLMDKFIAFLDRKLTKATQSDIIEVDNSDNLEQLKYNVSQEFELLGIDGVFAKYTIDYLQHIHADSCYTIATTIIKELNSRQLEVDQLWKDIVANYGKIPSIYQNAGEN